MASLGIHLKGLRKQSGLSYRRLADAVGISHNNLASYEADRVMPSFENAVKLCQFFNVPLEYLLVGQKAAFRYHDLRLAELFLQADALPGEYRTIIKAYLRSVMTHAAEKERLIAMPPVGVDHGTFRSLLGLVGGGRCWVKLWAPFESTAAGQPLLPIYAPRPGSSCEPRRSAGCGRATGRTRTITASTTMPCSSTCCSTGPTTKAPAVAAARMVRPRLSRQRSRSPSGVRYTAGPLRETGMGHAKKRLPQSRA